MKSYIKNKRIFIAGHNGRMGKEISLSLQKNNKIIKPLSRIDYTRQQDVEDFFSINKPEIVIICAAKVGGINENINENIKFIYDNTMIQNNIINASYTNNVQKLIFISSACVYPKYCNQPMKESDILSGSLEPTNEFYSLAKISGMKLCEAYYKEKNCKFISVVPTNLYGKEELYSIYSSHVIPSLFKKFDTSKIDGSNKVTVWGSGEAYREFLYISDFVEALNIVIENYNSIEPINIGFGTDIKIKDLVYKISNIFEFKGETFFDKSMPEGMHRKLLDSSKIFDLGWQPKISLDEGLKSLYKDFKKLT